MGFKVGSIKDDANTDDETLDDVCRYVSISAISNRKMIYDININTKSGLSPIHLNADTLVIPQYTNDYLNNAAKQYKSLMGDKYCLGEHASYKERPLTERVSNIIKIIDEKSFRKLRNEERFKKFIITVKE